MAHYLCGKSIYGALSLSKVKAWCSSIFIACKDLLQINPTLVSPTFCSFRVQPKNTEAGVNVNFRTYSRSKVNELLCVMLPYKVLMHLTQLSSSRRTTSTRVLSTTVYQVKTPQSSHVLYVSLSSFCLFL